MKYLGKNINFLLKQGHKTKSEFAEAVGISRGYLSDVSNGKAGKISDQKLSTLCEYFKIDTKTMLYVDLEEQFFSEKYSKNEFNHPRKQKISNSEDTEYSYHHTKMLLLSLEVFGSHKEASKYFGYDIRRTINPIENPAEYYNTILGMVKLGLNVEYVTKFSSDNKYSIDIKLNKRATNKLDEIREKIKLIEKQ